ncbi:MAG: UDP-N-acetylmuramate--L-alanine ligase [Patescibacteria group bacterium]|nr:UDP-N-acetylmuramate--L-alanine ligase [Patescibacteria group bacterium]
MMDYYPPNFLKDLKKIHLTGIKGVGMTALALCLVDAGCEVSGSDVSDEFVTDEVLRKRNISWKIGFSPSNVDDDINALVFTAAHGGLKNPEVMSAKDRGIPVFSYAQFMANLANTKDVIGVCGVGGKSTTSAMIANLFDYANLKPSYIVGVGGIFPLGFPGHYEKDGKFFVCESDEYAVSPGVDNRPKFYLINHKILVVTNIEYDHPDIYHSFAETKKAFRLVFEKLPRDGLLVACVDNSNVASLLDNLKCKVITYGFSENADFRIQNYYLDSQKALCRIINGRIKYEFKLSVPGRFNALNALASFIVGKHVGINVDDIILGLESYLGCRRRFEIVKTQNGITYVDDYAHHPKEILNTIHAAREWFSGRRIIVLFQPHTYSRTKALFDDFSFALSKSDVVGLVDIFSSAREEKDDSVNSQLLVDKIKTMNKNSFYIGGVSEIDAWLDKNVMRNDVVITMGAGDIYKYHYAQPSKKYKK